MMGEHKWRVLRNFPYRNSKLLNSAYGRNPLGSQAGPRGTPPGAGQPFESGPARQPHGGHRTKDWRGRDRVSCPLICRSLPISSARDRSVEAKVKEELTEALQNKEGIVL